MAPAPGEAAWRGPAGVSLPTRLHIRLNIRLHPKLSTRLSTGGH